MTKVGLQLGFDHKWDFYTSFAEKIEKIPLQGGVEIQN